MSGNIGGDEFRGLMRHVPSPVMVLTYNFAGSPRGVTIGSFASVSLKPPLVSFNLMNDGSSAEDIHNVSHFAIHVLRHDQVNLSEQFARSDLSSQKKFDGLDYQDSSLNVPLISNCLAVMECKLYDIISAGDHSLVLGEVLKAEVVSPSSPLLYFQRSYYEVGNSV